MDDNRGGAIFPDRMEWMEWKKEGRIVWEIDLGVAVVRVHAILEESVEIHANDRSGSIADQSADGCVVPRFCRLRREKGRPLLDARTSRANRKQLNSVQE